MDESVEQRNRLGEWSEEFQLGALFATLYSLPQAMAFEADALVVHPGMGEEWRVENAVRIWDDPRCKARYLIFTGEYQGEESYKTLTIERLQSEFGLTKPDGVIIFQTARHTPEQASQAVQCIVKENLRSLAVLASPYHCARAFCTDLKQMNEAGILIPMIPVPTIVSPEMVVPESGLSGWESIPGEFQRILDYQAKGDVATLDEVREYLRWFWKSDFINRAA